MASKKNKPKVWRVVFTHTFVATRDIYANSKAEAEDKAQEYLDDADFCPSLEDQEGELEIKKVYHRPDIAPCECDVNLVDNPEEGE